MVSETAFVGKTSRQLTIEPGPIGLVRQNGEFVAQSGVKTGPLRELVVYGPICDPNDRIPIPLSLSTDIAEGDWIEIGLVGAYGAATVTNFNGYGTVNHVTVRSALTS